MTEKFDWVAVGPYGVYAMCVDEPDIAPRFKRTAKRKGHAVERVSRAEACERHREYLRRCEEIRAATAEIMSRPSPSPQEAEAPTTQQGEA